MRWKPLIKWPLCWKYDLLLHALRLIALLASPYVTNLRGLTRATSTQLRTEGRNFGGMVLRLRSKQNCLAKTYSLNCLKLWKFADKSAFPAVRASVVCWAVLNDNCHLKFVVLFSAAVWFVCSALRLLPFVHFHFSSCGVRTHSLLALHSQSGKFSSCSSNLNLISY